MSNGQDTKIVGS